MIGNGDGQLAGSITNTAAQLRSNAVTVGTQVQALAVVVAVAIALLPAVPFVAVYPPLRVARARRAAGLKRPGLRPPAGWADTGDGSEPDRG